MRSSACKYVLDKVSKFEKKYAKPIKEISKREEDDDLLSSKDNSSSEHAVNKLQFIKKKSAFRSHESESLYGMKLNELDPLECNTIDALDIKTISESFRNTRETKKKTGMKQKSNRLGNTFERARHEYNDIKKIDTNFFSDSDESLLTKDLHWDHSFEDINESTGYKVNKDSYLNAENSLKDNLISIEKGIESNKSETPPRIGIEEDGAKKGRLHVNLNLKLDEDPNEISDLSSKGIASLSIENSISSQNVPIRVFTIEDLIGAEELKSVSEELRENFEEKSQVSAQIPSMVDNSDSTSLLIADDLHLNSKSDDVKVRPQHHHIREVSKNSSVEGIKEIIANTNETSIEEDIEEVIESSGSENCEETSEPIHSSSKDGMLSPETKTKIHKNAIMSESSKNDSENISKLNQVKGNHSFDESDIDFVDNDIILHKKKSDVVHQHVENREKQLIKYNSKKLSEIKNHPEQDFKSMSDNHNRPHRKNTKLVKHFNREKYLENEWKLLKKSKNVLQGELHNVQTQTENILAETYDFEKRMDTIMKASFNSMTEVNNVSLEVNNVFSEQTSHSAAALNPLERGFNCALKQQIELTKHFVCAEYNMYAVCMAAIKEMSSTYTPATLHYNKKRKNHKASR